MSGELRRTRLHILAVSGVVLFLELALIRWMPASIHSLAFFSNLVLMATFYGFGLGILCGGSRPRLMRLWPFYFLTFVGCVLALRECNVVIPEQSLEWIWTRYRGDRIASAAFDIPLEATLVVVFFGVAVCFVPLGQRLAQLMGRLASLDFYQFDLLGSLVGITLFALISAASAPAWSWFLVVALAVLPLLRGRGRLRSALLVVPLLAASGLVWYFGRSEIWSPYYSIQTERHDSTTRVYVNRFFHQESSDLRGAGGAAYALPYRFFDGGEVLVIGAGTGNDVAAALRHGAASVDAVEIDPVILRLGNDHPLHPYRDPRVRAIVQDARTYLHNVRKRYDLVVFGTLDSHALLSAVSTVRLDNYVYTRESIAAARRCLKPGGTLAMLYGVPTEGGTRWVWIRDRLIAIVVDTFGEEQVRAFSSSSAFTNLAIIAKPEGGFGPRWDSFRVPPVAQDTLVPTDDWPFLYLESARIPEYQLRTIPVILLLGAVPILALLPSGRRRPQFNFLVLGAGFLLLETSTVTRLSLLFGSTWIVNSVVFFGILLMVLLANAVARRMRTFPVRVIFGALGASLLACYLIDIERLLYATLAIKLTAGIMLTGIPVFFAGLVFSQLFKRERDVQYAFGSNLLGAFLGGFCEYLALITGFRGVILVILALYAVSCVLTSRQLGRTN